MEGKRLSSSRSVRGCGNQRQSGDWGLAFLLRHSPRVRGARPAVGGVTGKYQCHLKLSKHSFPSSPRLALNSLGFRGSNRQRLRTIMGQLSVTSLTCNYWAPLKVPFVFFSWAV